MFADRETGSLSRLITDLRDGKMKDTGADRYLYESLDVLVRHVKAESAKATLEEKAHKEIAAFLRQRSSG